MSVSSFSNDDMQEDVNVKYTFDINKKRQRILAYLKTSIYILLWYVFSIVATVINKRLLSTGDSVNPLTLTFFHVFIGSICDTINMGLFHRKELNFYFTHIGFRTMVRYLFPLACAMLLAKSLTYMSYGVVPVSLTHTVKALQPFFNVLIIFLWTGKTVNSYTMFSLVPIVFGVIYASVNEIDFKWSGFIYALLSTIISVFQGIYLKMLMKTGLSSNYIHIWNATMSWVMFSPAVIFFEIKTASYHNLKWRYLILSSVVQYMSSIASYYAMSQLSSLSYSIASTFKRVAIILFTSIIFGKKMSFSNIMGIFIATCGAVLYNIANKKNKGKDNTPSMKQPLGMPVDPSFISVK